MLAMGLWVDLIGYACARAILPLLSFGRVYAAPFAAAPSRSQVRWYRRDTDGRIELRQDAAGWIGFGIFVLVLFAAVATIRAVT